MKTRTTQYRWVILAVATFAQACACFFVQGFGSIALNVQAEMALSNWQIGILVSAAQLIPLIGLLVAGELLDRYSERFVVGIGTMIVGAALFGAALANSYIELLIFLTLLGLGYSTAQPGGSKSVSNWFAGSQLGFAMGIRQAGLPLGGAMAALLLPFIAFHYSTQAAFFAGGVAAMFGAILFMLLYTSPEGQASPSKKQINLRSAISSRLLMATDPSMRNIMLSGASLTASQYAISVFLVLYLHTSLGLDSFVATTMFFVALGSGIAGRIVLATWSDRCKAGRYYPVLTCLGAVSLILILLPFLRTQNLIILSSLMALTGFFAYGWYGPWVAYVAETAPVDRKGFALGMAMTANQISVVLVPPIIGLSRDSLGTYAYGWAALALLSAVVLFTTGTKNIKSVANL
ncbi:MFS transporter [Pseudomonas ogarae]|uniref:3-(3-hydroxy-phenyl)propionate transporter MhpT n=2 Tax=Pseudomonas TaxID=286 RepID=A0ABN5G0H7_PSEO1|nr:MFS transporter [Pseudomonas ogarae]AEV60487.1 Major facilitator family transporter [Pseudomonas ogarae]AUO44370.1 3-(3-hydroxy-phenyl)propionate transporter MhpT [Pseudomonas ogarae]KKA05244.1 MFS transporter [Pseudomonas ogarae]PBJ24537.1 Hexuronate transporter [Pseudomonas ogarae]